eukprot:CAMPEP_0174843700 /NCGR_PEP_ID=MMETSP1114-20130205/10686_1 /TAXON_ID=312471 /ORGANISM="Neobodo designis, Strain CCAP 1951/1" /LENGTH=819 /DNA_ID=CAMNT_0016077927 /DNA_START=41 /DNA_END=2500 /DNA_ORIENTATION=-
MGCGNSKETEASFPIKDKARNNTDYEYESWSKTIVQDHMHVCHPLSVDEALEVVNWAVAEKKRVRVMGIRHGWSPITIAPQNDEDAKEVVLVVLDKIADIAFSTMESDPKADGKPTATVPLGMGQLNFLTVLQEAERKAGPETAAPGYGISHCPAPDSITVGGMIAINGHGTAVANEQEEKIVGKVSYGSYSNRVVALNAVVWDDKIQKYVCKEFLRNTNGGKDIAPFLTSVGRAFLTQATLQVEPNYYMRCRSFMGIGWETMFAKPNEDGTPAEKSMAWFMERHGRVEAIWYPFTDKPWLKVWTVTGNKRPKNSKAVNKACNYPFSDELPDFLTGVVDLLTGSWGKNAQRIEINPKINEGTKREDVVGDAEEADKQKAEIHVAKEVDAEVHPENPEEQEKVREATKKKFEDDKHMQEVVASLEAHRDEAQAVVNKDENVLQVDADGDGVADSEEAYEAEEGNPLDGAGLTVLDDNAKDTFWDVLGLLKFGGLTPWFGKAIYDVTLKGLKKDHSYDIWGPSKDTLIYVKDTTIKVTANGYAVICNRKHVAMVMHQFAHMFHDMLTTWQKKRLLTAYPIAMPLEIRVTGLDEASLIADGKGLSPSLSGLYTNDEMKAKGFDCCLWLDILSMPGNFGANEFYHELEQKLLAHPDFNSDKALLRPEWSKGWGYTKSSAWAQENFLEHTRAQLPEWNSAMDALNAADKQNLFTNPWMKNFFRKVDAVGEGESDEQIAAAASKEEEKKEEAKPEEEKAPEAAAAAADDDAPAAEEKKEEAAAPAEAEAKKDEAAAEEAPAAEEKEEAPPAAEEAAPAAEEAKAE